MPFPFAPHLSSGILPESQGIRHKGPPGGVPCHIRHPCQSCTFPPAAVATCTRGSRCFPVRPVRRHSAVAPGPVAAIVLRTRAAAACVRADGTVWPAAWSAMPARAVREVSDPVVPHKDESKPVFRPLHIGPKGQAVYIVPVAEAAVAVRFGAWQLPVPARKSAPVRLAGVVVVLPVAVVTPA